MRLEFNNSKLSGADIKATARAAAKQVKDLWQPYEEKSFARELETDKSKWNEDYFHLQEVYLKTNFSEKRFNHLVEVHDYLKKK